MNNTLLVRCVCTFLIGLATVATAQKAVVLSEKPQPTNVRLRVNLPVQSEGKYEVEVEIDNLSQKQIIVKDMLLELSTVANELGRPEKLSFSSPVNVFLGIPIYPLPDGAIYESSLDLRPHQIVRKKFNLAEAHWNDGESKSYREWKLAIPNGDYFLSARVLVDGRFTSSAPIRLTKESH